MIRRAAVPPRPKRSLSMPRTPGKIFRDGNSASAKALVDALTAAQTDRETEGFIKLMAGPRGRILGVSIVGASAGEMIGLWALALSKKMSVRDIAGHVAPYPTMGEIGKRAALAYFTGATRSGWVRRIIRFLRIFG